MRKAFSPAFTIVELLIVIVVIGILTTIAIVSFNGITQRATSATLQTEIESASKLLGNYAATEGHYPADLAGVVTNSANAEYQYTYDAVAKDYCLSVTSPSSSTLAFHFSSSFGKVEEGLCDGHSIPGGPPPVVWSAIAGGNGHFCGIYTGKSYCWGNNAWGQLGNNQPGVRSSVPVSPTLSAGVLADKTITAMATGSLFSCAVTSEGKVYCWGYNNLGQLGTGDTNNSPVPVAVNTAGALAGKTVTAVSAGNYHACVLASAQIYCWGNGGQGQLGQGADSDSNTPVAVDISGVLSGKTIVKLVSGGNHTCVIASDAKAYCWGYGWQGQLGDGVQSGHHASAPAPVDMSGVLSGKSITDISAAPNNSHTCAIASGAVYCWGEGSQGRLGTTTYGYEYSPLEVIAAGVLSGKTMTKVAAGKDHTCALDSTGKAYCWGNNSWGAIGVGSNNPSQSDTAMAVDASGALSGKVLTGISAAADGTCAYAGAEAFCWGYNYYYQLGNGNSSVSKSNSPVLVTNP